MEVIFSTHMTQARRRPRPQPPPAPPPRRWRARPAPRPARRVQEQPPVGDDLRSIALLTVRSIPGAGALATLDIHPATLLQELTALLRQLAPGHHAEPFGLLTSLTVRGGIVAAGSHPKAGQGVAVGRIGHPRVRPPVTDDHYLVEARHLPSPFWPSYSSSLP